MELPYETKEVIYYGEKGFYDAETLGQMLSDGFIEKDGDILIPVGTEIAIIQDEFGDDDTEFRIGDNIYDLYIDEDLKEEYLNPLF